MSVWHLEVLRADGDLYAFIKLQNDYTGSVVRDIRDIHLTGDKYWISADGMKIDVTKERERFLQHEAYMHSASEWYKKTKF